MSDSPLRILHLTTASEAGGLSRYLLDLCAGLHARGHQVAVAGQRGAWHDRFEKSPWPWIDLPLGGGPLSLFKAGRVLSHYLAEHPVDIVQTHYRRSTLVARRAVPYGKHRPPILYTVHLADMPITGPRRWLTDFGDQTHAPSQGVRQWLVEKAKLPAERISLVPHGIDIPRYPRRDEATKQAARTALKLPLTATVAAFVGRLDYPKNADWMLDIADMPDLHILMAGDGPDAAAFRREIEKRDLAARVRLLGDCDVLPAYQAADALLLPSLREGFGLACAEAMCVGVPVLRTHTAGTEELIIDGVTGRAVPIDRRQFADAAREFLSDRAKLDRMGTAAAEHIRRDFTLDRQIDRTIDLYRRLAETARR